jgi:pilus assembly protein CpaC
MNRTSRSFSRRSLATACLLLGPLALASLIALGQQPAVIPPGPATPNPGAGQAPSQAAGRAAGQPSDGNASSPYYNVKGFDDHVKMVVNTSRFLVLDKKIPQVQVNNPDVLDVTPVSPNIVQISAKRTGVTQVNLWGDDKKIYTVNVVAMGDAAELTETLHQLFPRTALTVTPINGNSVMLSGFVDQQDAVPKIVAVAGKYFPEVFNNMRVSGAQQAILHVKVVEVSRTKLRNFGFDWAQISSNGNVIWSGVNGLLTTASGTPFGGPGSAPDNVFKFNIGSANAFYGVLNALRSDSLAKLLSEPDLVAISGQPAYILVGGEVGYQTTNAVTGTTVGFKEYGTRLEFVPVVLGNGKLHIDVLSRVSDIDAANSINGIPALKTREVRTGVELRAGQTLAIAGLLEQKTEASVSGFPWISEVPYLGVPFSTKTFQTNEVELLVLLTPEIVDPLEPSQVPRCLPGSQTADPSDWELFFKGHIEVPNCCPCEAPISPVRGYEGGSTGFNFGGDPNSPQNPQNRAGTDELAQNPPGTEPGFIGPIGYDVLK